MFTKYGENELKLQGKILTENSELLKTMSMSRGLVTQTTLDFQKSCLAILNRQKMLKTISSQIQSHLQHYTNFEEMQTKVDEWETLIVESNYSRSLTEDQCRALVTELHQIQSSVKFFKGHL